MTICRITAFLLVLTLCRCVDGQSLQTQSSFCSECEIMHPVAVPAAVLDILKKDQIVHEALKAENLSMERLPVSWFIATKVSLGSADETDYLVQGQNQLMGAHATHFWVLRETPSGIRLVLRSFADGLTISRKRSGGFRIIVAENHTAVSLWRIYYRLSAGGYKQFRQDSGNL